MFRFASPRRSPLRRLLSAAGALVGGALALFHLWLFAGRLGDLSIVRPEVLASWLGSAALGLFALWLKRRGHALLSGRSGLVFWLLVLLLHVGPIGAHDLTTVDLTLALGLGLELAVAACLLALLLGSSSTGRGLRPAPFVSSVRARALALSGGPFAAPRPPPSR